MLRMLRVLAIGASALGLALLVGAQAPAPAPPPGQPLEPIASWPLRVDFDAPRWLEDVVAFRAAFAAGDLSMPRDLDLSQRAVLAVPAVVFTGNRLVWRTAAPAGRGWRIECAVEKDAGGDPVATPNLPHQRGALFLLPRLAGPVHVVVRDAEGEPPPIALSDPANSELPRVLGAFELGSGGGDAVRCERATTPEEWRLLRASLGDAGKGLPDDYADFRHTAVILVAPGRARTFPGFQLSVGTEEGVDVVTVRQAFPSGRLLPERAPALLLTLPRRPRQLAVVLGDNWAAAGKATTIATFDPP